MIRNVCLREILLEVGMPTDVRSTLRGFADEYKDSTAVEQRNGVDEKVRNYLEENRALFEDPLNTAEHALSYYECVKRPNVDGS